MRNKTPSTFKCEENGMNDKLDLLFGEQKKPGS